MAADWGPEPDDAHDVVDLNLTSLVDVVLVLLVVFMVSTSAIVDRDRLAHAEGKVDLQLPSGRERHTDLRPPEEVEVQVDVDGNLALGGATIAWADLLGKLGDKLGRDPNLHVRIDADQRLPVQKAVEVLERLQNLGIKNVGLGTQGKP